MFSGPQATQGRLTEALRDYDVIHVATHAVVDSRDHDRVHLALADGDSALEFSGLTHHPRARVVVLAACRTATGPRSQGEGLMNLARPFLATGVNHAVVTLTDVPDDGTAVLMGEFHSQLSRRGRHLRMRWRWRNGQSASVGNVVSMVERVRPDGVRSVTSNVENADG